MKIKVTYKVYDESRRDEPESVLSFESSIDSWDDFLEEIRGREGEYLDIVMVEVL